MKRVLNVKPILEQLLTGGVSANMDIMNETLVSFEVELDVESGLGLLVSLEGLSGIGQWKA